MKVMASRRWRSRVGVVGAAALTMSLAACGGSSSSAPASSSAAAPSAAAPSAAAPSAAASGGAAADCPTAGQALALGISVPALDTPFFSALINAATNAAKDQGGSVVQTANANRDAGQQVTDFRNLISAGANAIMAGVVDREAIKPALDYAKEKGVPVVVVDDQPGQGDVAGVVKADNLGMGTTAAETMAKLLPNGGTVLAISGDLKTAIGRDRKEGFAKKIAEVAPNIKVIDQTADWNGPKSGDVMTTVLSQTPDLAGIYLATDTLYLDPVLAALKARKRLVPAGTDGHVAIVAIDGGVGAHQAIRDGFLDATISQPVTDYGKYGSAALVSALNCQALAEGATDHQSTIVADGNYLVDLLPAPVVAKDNVDDPTFWGNAK